MEDSARTAITLFAPLLLGFTIHGVCMRTGLLRALTKPIDGGRRWRGQRLFGENKTFRGILAVAVGTAVGYAIEAATGAWPAGPLSRPPTALAVGFLVGAAAMAAELPNSLLKRRLGIAPGTQAGGMLGPLFHVLDQVDVAHQLVTVAGFALGMRATWR